MLASLIKFALLAFFLNFILKLLFKIFVGYRHAKKIMEQMKQAGSQAKGFGQTSYGNRYNTNQESREYSNSSDANYRNYKGNSDKDTFEAEFKVNNP